MTDPPKKESFYESRVFQGAVAVVGLLTAIWALVGAPRPWQVATEISAAAVALNNTEIVLDASAATAARFGPGESELQASQEAVAGFVGPYENEGFALRLAGGGCDEYGDLAVDMGPGHSEDVRDAALEAEPEGKLNLGNAVRRAVDDFQATAFKAPQTTNRIVIVTSGDDECGGDAAAEISAALANSEIDSVTIIALSPSRPTMARLEGLRRAIVPVVGRVELRPIGTKRKLVRVVRHVAVRHALAAKAHAKVVREAALNAKGQETATSGADQSNDSGSAPDSNRSGQDSDSNANTGKPSDSDRSEADRSQPDKQRRDDNRRRHSNNEERPAKNCAEGEAPTATGEETGAESTAATSTEPAAAATEKAEKECPESGTKTEEPAPSPKKGEESTTGTTQSDESKSSSAAPATTELTTP